MSENEGEFKKLFKAWLQNFVPNLIAKEMEKELFEIIENAQKEFPWFPKVEDVEGKSHKEIYFAYKRDVHKWAKKWFGR